MDAKKFIEILDKHVDQEGLVKELAVELVLPFLEAQVAKIDIIPGTDLDQKALAAALEALKKMVA